MNGLTKQIKKVFIVIVVLSFVISAQVKHETRAVWVATNFGLDWPSFRNNPELQIKELRQIFKTISEKNYNTVYFQVRANGMVFFNSDFEPYSNIISGKTGEVPPYDPSLKAIEFAREFGLEIHAWVNTVRCFSGTNSEPLLHPNHPVNSMKNFVKEKFLEGKQTYWLDMGYPESREYLTGLFHQLVTSYDFDGIQFDFFRYPGNSFDDNESYALYGNGQDKDNWRRNNLTSFLTEFYSLVDIVKPDFKVGATPIGIYKNELKFKGFQGYYNVYQDVEAWVANNVVDYIAPQIYWDESSEPVFSEVTVDWMKIKGDKKIFAGIGLYKQEVKDEFNRLVKISRDFNTDGFAVFRYADILGMQGFNTPALPAVFENKLKKFAFAKPELFTSEALPYGVQLSYKPEANPDLKYFALYSVDDRTNSYDFLKLLDPKSGSTKVIFNGEVKTRYNFALKNIDKFWNEDDKFSNVLTHENKTLLNLTGANKSLQQPLFMKGQGYIKLLIPSVQSDEIKVRFYLHDDEVQHLKREVTSGVNLVKFVPEAKFNRVVIEYVLSGERKELNL